MCEGKKKRGATTHEDMLPHTEQNLRGAPLDGGPADAFV